jgi:hypothetical protein
MIGNYGLQMANPIGQATHSVPLMWKPDKQEVHKIYELEHVKHGEEQGRQMGSDYEEI